VSLIHTLDSSRHCAFVYESKVYYNVLFTDMYMCVYKLIFLPMKVRQPTPSITTTTCVHCCRLLADMPIWPMH